MSMQMLNIMAKLLCKQHLLMVLFSSKKTKIKPSLTKILTFRQLKLSLRLKRDENKN